MRPLFLPNYKKYLRIGRDIVIAIISCLGLYHGMYRASVNQINFQSEKSKNEVLLQQIDTLRSRNSYQRFQIENLALARASVERCLEVFPSPAWRKEYVREKDIFVMDDLNIAYERKYLMKVSRAQYYGGLDEAAHGGEIAKTYEKYDRMALEANGKPILEYAWVRNRMTGQMVFGKFMKWKRVIDNRVFIYGMELEILNE